MILSKAFDMFADGSPICVMLRGTLENALPTTFVDELFTETARKQYTRELLFSDIVDLMGGVVCQVFPSVNAGYKRMSDRFSVSRRAVYGKINHVEPEVSRELVRRSAQRLEPIVRSMRKRIGTPDTLPGYRIRILDGNHLAATERRIGELRDVAAGPLPGFALVVLDPDLGLIVDVFPCEDGHAQERSLLRDVSKTIKPKDVWIDDRNFCTSFFLFQIDRAKGFFITRQHATNVRWEPVGERRKIGRIATGVVYQQRVQIFDDQGNSLIVRRITVRLDEPTEDGDWEIHILTNLPNRIKATRIAEVYRDRWKIEGAFCELARALNCEISSLGYPPAALFAFCSGLLAYNILTVVKTALAAAHGEDKVDDISGYYLAIEIRGMMRGMMVAIPDRHWERQFGGLGPHQMAKLLIDLAKRVNLKHFEKDRRGPKKPRPKRTKFKRKTHVSTARIIAQRKRGVS
jgi:IS4 transposase